MRIVHQNEEETMSYNGVIEGFRIIPHIYANAVNVSLASLVPVYKNCIIQWYRDEEEVYSGDLLTFVQTMFFRSFDTTLRMQFLNKENGFILETAAASVAEKRLADLSVAFEPQAGAHKFIIRMNDTFKAGTENSSYIQFDFDKSDEVCKQLFKLRVEPINITGDRSLQVKGVCSTLLYLQSDNEYLETNDGAFNGVNLHPIANSSCTSKYSENNYTGEELQIQEVFNLNGVVDLANTKHLRLQKSVRLSDREFMQDPNLTMKLRTASMAPGVSYALVYDLVTFVA